MIQTKLHIGASAPFQILHLTDTHLTHADLRDGERKVTLANKRANIFPEADAVLKTASTLSAENHFPIVHTGDLIDFVSIKNLEMANDFIQKTGAFVAAGNHEFSLYVGEAKEDTAYRNQSLAIVQKAFQNDIRMSSRMISGVNFVALDNGYYLFDEEQLAFLKNEVKKEFPIILLFHTPLFERALYDQIMTEQPCAYLVDVPETLMQGYPENRFEQQKADEITKETVHYIKNEPLIKAIIAGHIHKNYEGLFDGCIPQITTSCTDIRLINIT